MIETTYNRDTLLDILEQRVATVKFHKKDGSLRIMYCTLRESLIPSEVRDALKSRPNSHGSEEALTVYDLEEHDWRSFRLDSIIEVL